MISPDWNNSAALVSVASKLDLHAGATKSTWSAYSAARLSTTGNSRLHVGHHSAQKTRYTGLAPSERVYVPPSPSWRVKSGARGRSDVVSVTSGSDVVVSSGWVDWVVAGSPIEEVVAGPSEVLVVVSLLADEQAERTSARAGMTRMSRRTAKTLEQATYIRCKSAPGAGTPVSLYNRRPVPNTTLYFAYGSLLDPHRISEAAPGARFLFTAHYPETKLDFVATTRNGAVPTLTKESGHTVWGGVFEVPDEAVDSLTRAEEAEGRKAGFDLKAVDREGNKHDCLTFIAVGEVNGDPRPDPEYLESMINGARHWSLPAGWVMGLEDLSDDAFF